MHRCSSQLLRILIIYKFTIYCGGECIAIAFIKVNPIFSLFCIVVEMAKASDIAFSKTFFFSITNLSTFISFELILFYLCYYTNLVLKLYRKCQGGQHKHCIVKPSAKDFPLSYAHICSVA